MFVVGTFGRHGLKSHQAWSFCMLVAQLLERLKKKIKEPSILLQLLASCRTVSHIAHLILRCHNTTYLVATMCVLLSVSYLDLLAIFSLKMQINCL